MTKLPPLRLTRVPPKSTVGSTLESAPKTSEPTPKPSLDRMVDGGPPLNTASTSTKPKDLEGWRAQLGQPATYRTRGGELRMGLLAEVKSKEDGTLQVGLRFARSELIYDYAASSIVSVAVSQPSAPKIDPRARPEIRVELEKFVAEHPMAIPRCRLDESEAVAAGDATTNCVSYALGKKGLWDDLGLRERAYSQHLSDRGFIALDDVDTRVVEGYEKVAVYGFAKDQPDFQAQYQKLSGMLPVPPTGFDFDDWLAYASPSPDDGIVTHVAVQTPSGAWESKLGAGPAVRVAKAEDFGGGDYGEPIRVFIRRRTTTAARL